MLRISVKAHLCVALTIVAILAGSAGRSLSQDLSGTAIGPGVGGQVHAFAFDPEDTNTAYAGGDVCGVYKYTYSADGGSWAPWSDGLGSGDLNRSFYVDDLLVLGASDGVDDNSRGVYAATQGGLYFRGTNASTWTCLSNSFYYTGGFADNAFNDRGIHDTALRVPFSSLAFDSQNKKVYLAAGYGRITDDTQDYSSFFPAQGLCNGKANSLWVCNVGQGGGQVVAAIDSTAYGNARQVTVANYPVPGGTRTEVVVASDFGIGVYKPASGVRQMIWPPSDPSKSRLDINTDSIDPWGVAMGSDGTLYGLMSRASWPARNPGLWQFNMTTDRDTTNWVPVKGDDSLWPYAFPGTTWSYFTSAARDPLSDLTELSVRKVPGGDEIFVGEGHNGHGFGQAGYFRFGSIDAGTGRKRGWAHIHRTSTNPSGGVEDVIGSGRWRAGTVVSQALTTEQKGWHAYFPSLRALAPFAVHPNHPNIMVGIDYGIPLMTRDGGITWYNLYSESVPSGGWKTRGLNLMCATSSAFLGDGRLVAGALDYGAFCASGAANTSFVPLHDPLHVKKPFWPRAADIEVVRSGTGEEIYMADNQRGSNAKIWAWFVSPSTASWDSATTNLRGAMSASGPMEISDLEFAGPDTAFAAVGLPVTDGRHYYVCVGTRPHGAGAGSWVWRNALDLGAEGHITKIVNKLRVIPGTQHLLYGAKYQNDNGVASDGGLFCVANYADANWAVSPWLAGGAVVPNALTKLGRNVTSIAVDELGLYAYAGCSGHDSPWTQGRGGVIRFAIANGAPADTTILAGATSDRFGLGTITNFPGGTDPAAWEYCTHVPDIKIDLHNPRVIYAAVDNGSYFDDDFGAWCCRDTAWTQVWRNPEAGSGAATIGIAPGYPSKLYVGTRAQEFFSVDIAASGYPNIVPQALYPVLAGVGGPVHAFATTITSPSGATVDSAAVYLAAIGGKKTSVRLYDDGVAPDLEQGDHIFTSRRFAAAPDGPGTYTVRVRAHDSNGCYDLQDVNVTVVANATSPVITAHAVYPMRAGSTDTSRVLAVQVSTPAAATRVTADIAGLGGTGSVRLRDDGKGEDIKKGDGIYTSAPFAAGMADSGSYFAAVSAEPMTGATVQQAVEVRAVANAAKFADVTGSTDQLKDVLTEQPYSAVYFKSAPEVPTSPEIMIVTFDNDGSAGSGQTPQILQMTSPNPTDSAPQFTIMTGQWIPYPGLSRGGRGVCYADYDNDGDNDFFICNPSSGGKLLENRLSEGGGFEDVTSAVFGADTPFLAQSITAAWGDYNADSFPDLCVASTNYLGSVQSLSGNACAVTPGGGGGGGGGEFNSRVVVFRNRSGATLEMTANGGPIVNNIVLSVCWDDIEDDGDLDLITSKFISGGFQVYENNGYSQVLGDHLLYPSAWGVQGPDPDSFYGTNAVSTFDYDNDGCRDLVLTYVDFAGNQKVKLLVNNYKQDLSRTFTPIVLEEGIEWNGATVEDFDHNGQDDILLHPRAAGIVPALYMANGAVPPSYDNIGHALGLRSGITGGVVAADFDGDQNLDLFLGRSGGAAARALYRNVAGSTSSSQCLAVRVHTLNQGGALPLGTSVQFHSASRRGIRIIEGGSGRGSQSSNQLLLGLGDVPGPVTVTVRYPSGEVDGPMSVTPNGQPIDVWEDQAPVFSAFGKTNPTYTYALEPGHMDWIFRWRTLDRRGDPKLDKIEIWNYMNYEPDGDCGVGIGPNAVKSISFGDSGVEHSVYRSGSEWFHQVHWKALPCGTNCKYKFRVTSGLGSQSVTSPWYIMTTNSFCVADPGDPNQQ